MKTPSPGMQLLLALIAILIISVLFFHDVNKSNCVKNQDGKPATHIFKGGC